jgi:membrane protein DedA with SNARE-associated domain
MSLLTGVVDAVESLVDAGHGWGLSAVMLVETVFPPVPSEVVLPLAGSQVAVGQLSMVVAVVAATVGSVLGAWVLYALGRFGGRPTLLRLHPLLRIDERRLARAQAWFDRHGNWMVVIGRLVPGLRALVSVPAGMGRMPQWRFLGLTAIGSLAWNAGLIELGNALAARWTEVEAVATPAFTALLAAAAIALPAVWWRRHHRSAAAVAA